jgi:hypothetical protein
MERIGPFRFGGDMDDPNNPASPFISREDVEAAAAAELGFSDDDLAKIRAARERRGDVVVDQASGNVSLTREEGLDMLCQGLLAQIREAVVDLKAAREGNYWGDVQKVEENLAILIPDSMQG